MTNTKSIAVDTITKKKILVIDDDKDFAESISDILESYGYDVEMAYSSKGCMTAIRNFHAQVALIDIRLGQADGINLISKLRDHNPQIICVMMTAYAAIDTAIKAIQQGASHLGWHGQESEPTLMGSGFLPVQNAPA